MLELEFPAFGCSFIIFFLHFFKHCCTRWAHQVLPVQNQLNSQHNPTATTQNRWRSARLLAEILFGQAYHALKNCDALLKVNRHSIIVAVTCKGTSILSPALEEVFQAHYKDHPSLPSCCWGCRLMKTDLWPVFCLFLVWNNLVEYRKKSNSWI